MQVDGYSLDAQRDKLTKYAEYQDMEVVKEFSDAGHSGKNINGRPEFSQMLEDIANGEDGVDFVHVFKLSRFGRNAVVRYVMDPCIQMLIERRKLTVLITKISFTMLASTG